MTKVFNRTPVKITRRSLRQKTTRPETLLWKHLRNRRLNGTKFHRQYSIGRYIVDFYCPTAKLVIELDGDSHFNSEAQEYDKIREGFMNAVGARTIRFTNKDIRENLPGVLETIQRMITSSSPLQAS